MGREGKGPAAMVQGTLLLPLHSLVQLAFRLIASPEALGSTVRYQAFVSCDVG